MIYVTAEVERNLNFVMVDNKKRVIRTLIGLCPHRSKKRF